MQKEMELTNLRAKVAELMAFMPSVTLAGFGRSGGGAAVGSAAASAMRYSPTYTAVQQDSSVSPDYTAGMSSQ